MMTILDWSHGTYWSRRGGIGYGKVEVGGPLLYLCLLTKKPAKQFCLVTNHTSIVVDNDQLNLQSSLEHRQPLTSF